MMLMQAQRGLLIRSGLFVCGNGKLSGETEWKSSRFSICFRMLGLSSVPYLELLGNSVCNYNISPCLPYEDCAVCTTILRITSFPSATC
jgi:hypothetical protein